jgi:hypothetical protein
MTSPTFVDSSSSSSSSGPYGYLRSTSSYGMSSGSHHGQCRPMIPAPVSTLTGYSYMTAPPQYSLPTSQLPHSSCQVQQHQNQAPTLEFSVATGGGDSSTIPRSISMEKFSGNWNGILAPSIPWFNGRSMPPTVRLFLAPPLPV